MSKQNHDYKGGGSQQQSTPPNYGTFNPKWIEEKIDMNCITFAEKFGEYLAKNSFTTTQIRNIFGEVKRIQLKGIESEETAFLLLKPKIAYATTKAAKKDSDKHVMEAFKVEITKAHNATQKDNKTDTLRFERFCKFFEAILAYHKVYGGKN